MHWALCVTKNGRNLNASCWRVKVAAALKSCFFHTKKKEKKKDYMGMGMDQQVRPTLYYNHNKVFMLPDEGLCLHNLWSFYKQPTPCLTILYREKQWNVTDKDNGLVSDTCGKVVSFSYLDPNANILSSREFKSGEENTRCTVFCRGVNLDGERRRYGICLNQFNVKQLC